MQKYELCLPGDDTLHAFQQVTSPFLELIISNVHESHTLAALHDLLLPKLMSGEIRVKDAEDMVKEAV
jgi:type I restriction enzyme, S subunit